MAKLLDILDQTGGARALWNEYAIIVYQSIGTRIDDSPLEGWFVRATDYLADDGLTGSRRVIVDCQFEIWDEVNGLLAELGIPDGYDGWTARGSER